MYYGKKKIIIIAIIIAVLIISLILGGLYIVLATDLLKPTNSMFFKYASSELEEISSIFDNAEFKEIMQAKLEMPYQTNALTKISYNGESTKNIVQADNSIQINTVLKEDIKNDKQSLDLKASYNNNSLIDISYAKSNNIIALKWEEIVQKYFIGIKNENLDEFVKKLGIEDSTNIPNKINTIDYLDLINITDQEKEYITQTYLNVIVENIPSQNYTKQKDMNIVKNGVMYKTNAYRLDLSAEELRNIEIKMFETLKQDSITLNLIATKAKILGLSDEYSSINGLTQKIDEQINKINASALDTSKGLSIVIYEYQDKVLQTEIILKNDMKITLDYQNENGMTKLDFIVDNLSDSKNYTTAKISITKQQENYNVMIDIDNKQTISIKTTISGTVNNDITSNIQIDVQNEDGSSLAISYDGKTHFGDLDEDIINLENNVNCVVLNNYNDEQLEALISRITARTMFVISAKMNIINNNSQEDNIQEEVVEQNQSQNQI